MHAHDDVVLGGVRVRQVRQGQPSQASVAVADGDGLHSNFLSMGEDSVSMARAGIFNLGTLTLTNSTVTGNTANTAATGSTTSGGGIYNNGGTLVLTGSTVKGTPPATAAASTTTSAARSR